jgi:anti-sigma B factor antagonist
MLATLVAEPLDTDGATLSVAGDLDIAAAPRLRTAIGDLMGQGVRHLEVDLEACEFIDSSGIGALLWGARRLDAAGGDLVAVHVHGAAARTIEVSGVESVLSVRG